MPTHLENFVSYIGRTHLKRKSKSKNKYKTMSKSRRTQINKLNNDYNKLFRYLKFDFIKILTNKYLEDYKYYNDQIKHISLFHITRRGEGISLFVKYKQKKYVYKIIYNIHSDYDSLMNIQNKMAAKKLSPKIINLFSEPEKLGDTNVQKLMRKKDLVFIIMDYIDSMELRDYYDDIIKHMDHHTADKEIKRVVIYLNKFLKALREIGVCHLDFTLDNILYSKSNKRIYLIDYGWMQALTDENNCIPNEIDFILNTKRPYYRQRIKSMFNDYNKHFNKKYKLIKTSDNYLKLS